MAGPASDFDVVAGTNPSHHIRNEQTGTGGDGKPIIAQVVLAGEHKRVFDGIQSLVLTGTAQNLTVPTGATHAMIYAEGATVNDLARYWHGSTPTASAGKRLKDHEEIATASPSTFSAINSVGTVTLRVEYYHYA
jgi:hypothetical protein